MATPDDESHERDMQLLEDAYCYLTEKKYPPGCCDTRKIKSDQKEGAEIRRKILDFDVPLHQFWCILRAFYTYNYIFEGEVNHIARVVEISCTIN